MRISELAARTGLPSHTIRFYEKQGLLNDVMVRRGANNYRQYSAEAADYLLLIRRAQAAGFKLGEIPSLLKVWYSGEFSLTQKQTVVRDKLIQIDKQITELEAIREYLLHKLTLIDLEERELAVIPSCV